MRASSILIMATVEDQENEHRGEEVSSTGKEAHASGCDRRTVPRGSNNVGGCQAGGNARQLNLPPFHDEQSRLDMAAVVVNLGLVLDRCMCSGVRTNWKYSSKSSPLQCQNNATIIIVKIPA